MRYEPGGAPRIPTGYEPDRGVVLADVRHLSGDSRAQVTRLVARQRAAIEAALSRGGLLICTTDQPDSKPSESLFSRRILGLEKTVSI